MFVIQTNMKYEDEYTEEDWKLIADRNKVEETQKKRRCMAVDTDKKIIKRMMRWQNENREHYRAYNNALKRRRYIERGKPKLSPQAETKMKRKSSLKKTKHNKVRGRVTKEIYINILMEIEKNKVANYLDEIENGKRKKIILCIIGESGAGKTLASLHLKYKLEANTICSFTTRPPRAEEVEGRDHHFVDIVPPQEELLAFTIYGNYKYYALKSQVQGPVTVYVIDEKGYLDLKAKFPEEYDLHPIYIKRKKSFKSIAGVSDHRMERDRKRAELLSDDTYDFIIENNGTKAEFFEKIETIYNNLLTKSKEYGW